MTIANHHIENRCLRKALLILVLLNLQFVYILPSMKGGVGGGSLWAQDVTISVSPMSPVLPPQAGEYMSNPGKFFSVKLMNNTDAQKLLHIGMHIDMLFPDQEVVMATPTNGNIPREPIVLAPHQAKVLNPVEMRNLFRHFTLSDIGLREDLLQKLQDEPVGLLPEGQYQMFMDAYLWDPQQTNGVLLTHPGDGRCQFNICYRAQPPRFLSPVAGGGMAADDPMAQFAVAKIDVNNPVQLFTWTQPTLNCNAQMVQFNYDMKVVKLGAQTPDEAILYNPAEYQASKLLNTTFTLPTAYQNLWKQDTTTVYAMQVTAQSVIPNSANSLNYSLIENDGKSDILLFRFYDPNFKDNKLSTDTVTSEKKDSSEVATGSSSNGDVTASKEKLYTFEQPKLIKPSFYEKVGRKLFVGDSIFVEWRKAWFAGGRGQKQDTIKFAYTVALYKGNTADSLKNIFKSKAIYTKKIDEKAKNLCDSIPWKALKGVQAGDYLVLRVTAKSTNAADSIIKMQGDSLNYVDFAIVEHFKETFECGANTADVANKVPIDHLPKKDEKLYIGDWTLTLNGDATQDSKTRTLKNGTGWINWEVLGMNVRVAVKFDSIKVNTDGVIYDGILNTYAKGKQTEFTAQQAVDSLFSSWGLDNIWGDLGLPRDVADKVGSTVNGEVGNLAQQYNLGSYYTYFKQAEKQWDQVMDGTGLDIYFPTELPDTIAKLLPEDFSLQIASMMFTPKGAVMNVIGEFVLPKCDVIENDVLIFGAPRLCVQKGRILPEDGVLALLSNFRIKDPDSGWDMTFKAPLEPLDPQDGCFLRWENDEFGGLGLEIAMQIPNLKRVIEGKVENTPPILDLQATIEKSWSDWIGRISMDPFQAEDLPGWTFTPGKDIIFDHSSKKNYQGSSLHFPGINAMPKTYDPKKVSSECGDGKWEAWQGIYINEISVQFPKWAVFGKGNEGLKIAGQKMFFDASGITCDIAALNLMEAQTGKAGGWEFDLDMAKVMIVQNNFDSCHIEGRFAIPLFGKKDQSASSGSSTGKSASSGSAAGNGKGGASASAAGTGKGGGKGNTDQGKIRFTCDIRHLTDSTTTYYTYDKTGKKVEHKKRVYGENDLMAYYFKTQQIDSLDFSCFVADVDLIKDQTYFMVAAIDRNKDKTDTYVELNMGGQINIADTNSTVNSIREYAKKLPLNMDFRGIHFAKMRLANFSYKDSAAVYKNINTYFSDSLGIKRLRSEAEWSEKHSGAISLFKSKELELTKECYLDLGEWSLSSPKKKLGPFSVELRKFEPDFKKSENKLTLGIEGAIGFCEDKVTAAVGVDITTDLTIPSDITNISGYDLGWGGIDFRSAELKADFGMLTLDGRLDVTDDEKDGKGYAGKLNLEIKELFKLEVDGGYFTHKASAEDQKAMKEDQEEGDDDKNYAWGYFVANMTMDAKTSPLRFDPLVITRIMGGFYYNCAPAYDKKAKTFGKAEKHYGMIGVSFGLGLAATAGEKTLNGNMDLNVIYDKKNHRLSTFAFKGNVTAVSGIIDANMMLLYQNDDKDRFLSLDITVEAGFDAGMSDKVAALNNALQEEKEQLDRFQAQLDEDVRQFESEVSGTLSALNSDYKNKTSDEDLKKNEEKASKGGNAAVNSEIDKRNAENKNAKTDDVEVGHTSRQNTTVEVSLNLLVTWKKDGVTYNTPKWHLYLGEPDKDKRCKIVLIDFKSSIVSVNIGADAYLCVGNELPNNGQLPPIPTEISDFLNGGSSTVNTNADLAKAEQSRMAAVNKMLGNVKGGVMVGASAWGYINVDLGLFYGYLKALAGFDISVADYGNSAFCVNLNKRMGRDGWYAMGQFYAYLAAKFGLHIKLGRLIDKRIDIVDAGIGGVFDCGLPSPTWVEGRARVKINLLGGLVKINKKFEFECGDRCVAFVGNALDDFNLFDTFNLGTDSIETGWDEANAYTVDEAMGRAMFTTTAALNSQYRLVDPTALADISDGIQPDSLLQIHAARTYIFNLDEEKNEHDGREFGTKGVRLWEFDNYEDLSEQYLHNPSHSVNELKRWMPSFECSITYSKRDLDCTHETSNVWDKAYNYNIYNLNEREIPVGVRDKQGTKYHLSGMQLKPGKCYMLVLTGTAYEVENGQRYWCEMVDTVRMVKDYQKWMQRKFYFFRTKEKEDVAATLDDLKPYIALAYPAPAVGEVTNDEWANAEAYAEDLCWPTIALKEDLSDTEFAKGGKLQWTLRSRLRNSKSFLSTETQNNKFVRNDNCVNMEPENHFKLYMETSGTDDNPLVYNLRLTYTQPSYGALVDWMRTHKYNRLGYVRTYYAWFTNDYLNAYNTNPNSVPSDSVHSALYIADWLKNNYTAPVDVDTLDIPKREVVLYDAWYRRSDRLSWQEYLPNSNAEKKLNGYRGYTDPLPYERPFIGVRPSSPGPNYSYPTIKPYTQNPYIIGEKGYLYENMEGQRLLDPYAYFSYLSNWVFIGGRAINSYNFDDIRTPHASESLIFSYNTADLTGVSQISGLRTADAMRVLRNSMAGVWNTWSYNDPDQPQYPLPTRLGPEYDLTFANQDGKAQAYYTAWNKEEQQKQKCYGARELWLDFAAPYYVAEALSNKLAEIADELTGKWSKSCQGDKFDQAIKDWNNTHRGQYLTVESRGFQVKVPYYQFPLIFGDCCVGGYDPVTDTHPNESKRGFGKSLGGKSNIIAARWKTYVSCLFWFRLKGGYPWQTNDDFNQFYEDKYLNGKSRKYIERESFNARDAMQYISNLQAYIYRVNSYDINTGLYTFNKVGACSDSNDMAPWFGRTNVTKDNDVLWPNWLDMYIGHPEVLVNGKTCQHAYKGYSAYQNLDTTPDEKPVDNSGTQSGYNGTFSGNSSRLHTIGQGTTASQGSHTMTQAQNNQGANDMFANMASAVGSMMDGNASNVKDGTQSANELIYQEVKSTIQKNYNEGVAMLEGIKAQDEALFKQILRKLVVELPELKTRLNRYFTDSGTSGATSNHGKGRVSYKR